MPETGPNPFDPAKFDNYHQIGGIQLARLAPAFGGDIDRGPRVALVNTGAGLRFTVALDRGGDIVDAFYNQHSLAYLSPNGLRPPSHAFHQGTDWLRNWAGGLVTTCGPLHIGHPRNGHGLHGHFSNLPAHVETVANPDVHHRDREMFLRLTIRDSSMFGPVIEIQREIRCVLGEPAVTIVDEVINRGDQPVEHHWLYHCNFGYPLLDEGTQFIYRGRAQYWEMHGLPEKQPTAAAMNRLKKAPGPLAEHAGAGERGLIVEAEPDEHGTCRVGLINRELNLAVELAYPQQALPRLANWQHFGPRGCYVSAIEPFNGCLLGPDRDTFERAHVRLEPGESLHYQLGIEVHTTRAAVQALAGHDGKVTAHV